MAEAKVDGTTVAPARPNRLERALGTALEWAIQRGVTLTGRRVRPSEAEWLAGPVGTEQIGRAIYAAHAREAGLEVVAGDPGAGLLPDFGTLRAAGFDPAAVHPEIVRFYERTAGYALAVRAEWRGPLRPFARTLIYLVSRAVEQLNLPTSPGAGMTSELLRLVDPRTGAAPWAGWLRRDAATGAVVYAGFYAAQELPAGRGRFVKVVFPLPGGSATVFLRPENAPGGAFRLVSAGRGFGDAGYYRVHRVGPDRLRVRRVPIEETIHVSLDPAGALRTDHRFWFARVPFLTLRYRMERRG